MLDYYGYDEEVWILLSREHTGYARRSGGAREDYSRGRWLLADLASRTLSRVGHEPMAAPAGEQVVRLAVPVGLVNPLGWLRAQRIAHKLYWSGRKGRTRVAALGAADLQEGGTQESAAALRKRLAPLLLGGGPQTRYYGGLRFDPVREPDADWAAFGAFRFVLPRFELHAGDGAATLVCNLVLPRDVDKSGEILEQIERLSPPDAPGAGLHGPLSRSDTPGFSGWGRNVRRALSAFSAGQMGKVVLARRADLRFADTVDATLLAEGLEEATPGCFHFYFEPEEGSAFLGASPERLYRRHGRSIESEAVAGTRPRGTSEADDEGLRDELLRSRKDRSEHDYVRRGIEETLGPLCEEFEFERGVSEMKLAGGRHLRARVRGRLREGVTDAEVLGALHPTPAVGGYPRGEALEKIRALEPFDRGWYAGPVGWIAAEEAEFAVGIRSGLVRGRNVALFSGAGIVAGSAPESEWAEIEQKIGDFTRMFGLEPGHPAR